MLESRGAGEVGGGGCGGRGLEQESGIMLPPEQERIEGGRRGAGDFGEELLEPGASFAAGAKRVGDAGMAESQR